MDLQLEKAENTMQEVGRRKHQSLLNKRGQENGLTSEFQWSLVCTGGAPLLDVLLLEQVLRHETKQIPLSTLLGPPLFLSCDLADLRWWRLLALVVAGPLPSVAGSALLWHLGTKCHRGLRSHTLRDSQRRSRGADAAREEVSTIVWLRITGSGHDDRTRVLGRADLFFSRSESTSDSSSRNE